MPKLHEILAAEQNLKGQATKCRSDLEKTFDKSGHFEGHTVDFVPVGEGQQEVREAEKALAATVRDELAWLAGNITPAIDAAYQVDEANTQARADIVLENGQVLAKNVPATALLQLEHRADEIHALVSKIPTMDSAKGFQPDSSRGKGIFRSAQDRRVRTEKRKEALVLYHATEKHPAQTSLVDKDVVVGHTITNTWSGKLTVAEKGEMLGRAEALRIAVKKARAKANLQDVDTSKKVASNLLDFVFKG